MNRRITSLLLGLNLLLALALVWLWLGPGSKVQWTPPAAQAPNLDDARAALLGLRPGNAAEFPQIAARPVFSYLRRPPPPAPAASEAGAPPPPPPVALDKLKMLGTISGPTLRGVLAEVEGESRLIRSGEQVGEWTLSRIGSSEATFEKGDEKRVVPLPLAQAGEAGKSPAAKPQGGQRAASAARPKAAPPTAAAAPAPAARPEPSRAPASNSASSGPADGAKPKAKGAWGP